MGSICFCMNPKKPSPRSGPSVEKSQDQNVSQNDSIVEANMQNIDAKRSSGDGKPNINIGRLSEVYQRKKARQSDPNVTQ